VASGANASATVKQTVVMRMMTLTG